jgi:hypothetical protein
MDADLPWSNWHGCVKPLELAVFEPILLLCILMICYHWHYYVGMIWYYPRLYDGMIWYHPGL